MRVLLVEDDLELAAGVQASLHQIQFSVDWQTTAEDALERLTGSSFELMLLDLSLPGMGGLELLRILRAQTEPKAARLPVMIMTAHNSVPERVAGLDAGADDYLVKPFALEELHARVRSVLRRYHGPSLESIAYRDLVLDLQTRQVTMGTFTLALSKRESVLLEALMSHPGRPVEKDRLLDALGALNDDLSDNAVEVYVHRLRKKLEPLGMEIRTLRGIGYSLYQTPMK